MTTHSIHPITSSFSPVISPVLSPLKSRINQINSLQSHIPEFNPRDAQNDESLLAEIGYKQELQRRFSTFQIFGISYSIMGILPSVASIAATGLASGPAGFLWSWVIASFLILSIGISMSELASAIPTSGGLYYWTFYYSPENFRVPLSFMIGLTNTMALSAGAVSVAYGNATEILAAIYLSKNGNFEITNGKTYGIFAACIIFQGFATCISSKNVAMLQTISSISHTSLLILFLIAVPIGTKINVGNFNNGSFIFNKIDNFSNWPKGWQFCLSMMTAVWTIGAFDSCVHMSEEAKNASYGVPIGICGSISVCGLLGWIIIIVINSCINPNIEEILSTETGFPIAQLFYDSLGRKWAIALMSLMAACQWLMGSSLITACSRQIWAFARDDGLPFCSIVKVVNKNLKVPMRAVILSVIISLMLGCLCLAGTAAANALFTLYVCGCYLAWCTPILLKLTTGKHKFKPGSFYLGEKLSKINNWISVLWGAFIMILCMFPANKNPIKTNMNYTVVISFGVWILALIYFFIYKYKYFHGPKSNLAPEDVISLENKKISNDFENDFENDIEKIHLNSNLKN
ncbi:GABA-specific high-affinity permease [Pichia californica]|uniref:GABA-specific high-affinity permease n=1 Tax=Pichia californica TaxID=460514 RepID=A0A9P7BF55_9ASCO|nr:GABA-specific high-affinity permease [[Candida] californica]